MPPLNFNFVMIYIIHKILISLKNNLNHLENSIFECFFKEDDNILYNSITRYNIGNFKP